MADAGARAIEVPFAVMEQGVVEIGSIAGGQTFELPPGQCSLRFEEFPGQLIRLVISIGKRTDFAVLRADPGLEACFSSDHNRAAVTENGYGGGTGTIRPIFNSYCSNPQERGIPRMRLMRLTACSSTSAHSISSIC
jgi:hypothetical protein